MNVREVHCLDMPCKNPKHTQIHLPILQVKMLANNFEMFDVWHFSSLEVFHEHDVLLYHFIIKIEVGIIINFQGPYRAALTVDYRKDNIEKVEWLNWWCILFQFRLDRKMRDAVLGLNRDNMRIILKI